MLFARNTAQSVIEVAYPKLTHLRYRWTPPSGLSTNELASSGYSFPATPDSVDVDSIWPGHALGGLISAIASAGCFCFLLLPMLGYCSCHTTNTSRPTSQDTRLNSLGSS